MDSHIWQYPGSCEISAPQRDPPSSDCFQALLLAAQGGCNESASELLNSFREYLLLVTNRRLPAEVRQKEAASDLVQESIVEACDGIVRFDGNSPEELRRWLRRILVRNVVDAQRRYQNSAKRKVSREVSLDRDANSGNIFSEIAADDPLPLSNVTRAEEAYLLERKVGQLPIDYQKVIQLRNRDGLSFAEIGVCMDRTSEAARKLWVRALGQLKRELDRSDERHSR